MRGDAPVPKPHRTFVGVLPGPVWYAACADCEVGDRLPASAILGHCQTEHAAKAACKRHQVKTSADL